jgi:glycosyltransferase involved in cell wall biosynthesis
MRVLAVTNMYPSPERPTLGVFVRSQIESLRRLGVAVDVHVIDGWRGASSYARALRELPGLERRARPDLVHAHYGLSGVAALRVAAPLVVSFCGDDVFGTTGHNGRITRRSLALARVSRIAARRADAVIVKSEEMRLRLAPTDAEVIPNGVDLDAFSPLPIDDARHRLGWSESDSILLFASDPDEPVKNWPFASEVARRLRSRGRQVRLEPFWGRPQHELVAAMSAADVLIFPSLHEGSPNVVKEAMSVALPVVAAPVGDCAERLDGCSPGAVVPHDIGEFVEAVERVLDAGGRSNGRERIASLSLESVARRVLGVYERALGAEANLDPVPHGSTT